MEHLYGRQPPTQQALRAVSRAQKAPLPVNAERMLILESLLESLLEQPKGFSRRLLSLSKGTEFMGFFSRIGMIREDMKSDFHDRAGARSAKKSVYKLRSVFEEFGTYLSIGQFQGEEPAELARAKGTVLAALDFEKATRPLSLKKSPAPSSGGRLYKQDALTTFYIVNELFTRLVPRIEKSFPGLVETALSRGTDSIRWQGARHRNVFIKNRTMTCARADHLDYACRNLGEMARDIDKILSAIPARDLPKAARDADILTLKALSSCTASYIPEKNAAGPVAHEGADNLCSMEDYMRRRKSGFYKPYRPL